VISRPEKPAVQIARHGCCWTRVSSRLLLQGEPDDFHLPFACRYFVVRFGAAAAGADVGKTTAVPVSELLGREVEDKAGETAGEVKDLVVNLTDGHIRYFVVETEDGTQARLHPDMLFAGAAASSSSTRTSRN
jgi:sporulation protein YlmC with PRC-barrel domain